MIRWVRHGQSTWNALGRLQGHAAHPPLTDLGRTQAAAAAEALAGNGVVRLLSSSAVRARQTAEIIGDRLGLLVHVEPLLVEQGLDEPEEVVAARLRTLLDRPGLDARTVAVTHGDTIRVALRLLGVAEATVPANGSIIRVGPGSRTLEILELKELKQERGGETAGKPQDRAAPARRRPRRTARTPALETRYADRTLTRGSR